jgi:hypothetical protein
MEIIPIYCENHRKQMNTQCGQNAELFDVELRLSPRWVGGSIGSMDATKTCHISNAYIFETNNRKVINNTSLDSL